MNTVINSRTACRSERPISPCVLICTLDSNKVCIGCGRSVEQISRWALMSSEEQWAVIDQLAAREGNN